ncbi:cyclin-F-like isoform X2 [Mizuhopecten yessoensis]|uniref:Cyclin-F n=1 Tax=Mizuhopecten yessoensis TaxID=6573 RepID=A0A210Q0B0_MIZYE|nr:cyclin-F-like isoform X2 [Mizuhopecten yessoensis]OWF42166.1 Cyclin-F [Mizuhopecten yessoensis]
MKVLTALSKFQKSPNTFIPVHMHMQLRPRKHNQLTIWHLPEEVILYILKGFHIRDILSMRTVHSYFRDVIDDSSPVWAMASFQDNWPMCNNLHHFQRAANLGNIEALIKLAIAYLYNEGLPEDDRRVTSNGEKAAHMFCKMEGLTPGTDPFSWLFIRPPWSRNGACCKEYVFTHMKKYLEEHPDNGDVQVCVAKTVSLLEEDGSGETQFYLQQAAKYRSGVGAYLHWQQQWQHRVCDRASRLESIRQLRQVAKLGHMEARLNLCKFYAREMYCGVSLDQAAFTVCDFIHSVSPSNIQSCFKTSNELTPSMRYILVDWLVEVAGMKDFSSQTLHVAVNVVDRYLRVHKTTRSKLQLLGVAAMVLCSRFLGKDIITIREAAWLTDNTYKYEDVVRMMGEITATLRGKIRVANSFDFVELFSLLAKLDRKSSFLAEYICELCLLQAEMGQYKPTEIAAASVLLARILTRHDEPWPKRMVQFTGFTIEDISRCAFHIHEKCFLEGSVVDHRDVTLQAVKLRYSDKKFMEVSEMEIMSYEELCAMLGVTDHIQQGLDVCVKFKNDDQLILSPSRKKRRCDRKLPCVEGRENTATPSIEQSAIMDELGPCVEGRENTATPSIEQSAIMDESVLSGYDGDKEDDEVDKDDSDDSFLEYDDSSEGIKCEELSNGAQDWQSAAHLANVGYQQLSPLREAVCSQDSRSSSGVSSPGSSGGEAKLSPLIPHSSLGISGHASHVFGGVCVQNSPLAGSEGSRTHFFPKGALTGLVQGSVSSYMTLRRTTKRKSRQLLSDPSSAHKH